MRLIKVLFFCAFGCLCISMYAQETKKTTSLSKLIPQLEQQYAIKFNYLESNIRKKVFFEPNLTLQNILSSLEKQTQLRFEKVDEKQVIIRELKPTDLVTVCGYVMSSGFARSQIEVQTVLTIESVLTDKNGYFELNNIPYDSNIVFRSEGIFLRSLTVASLFQTKCIDVEVSIFNEQLEEVILTNYLTKGVTKQAQKVSIDPTKFSVLPGITEPDIMKSLEHIPSVQSPFEMASKLYVRGSTPDQNLVLWNGIKTYSQSHFFGLLSAFNPYVVDHIDYYAKGVQAKYGDRLAGIIDMRSDTEVSNKFSGGAGTNMISADVFAKTPVFKDKLSILISARRAFTDALETPAYKAMAERVFQNTQLNTADEKESDFYFFDYSVGIQAKPTTRDGLYFNTLFAQNKLNFKSSSSDNGYTDNIITKNEGYSLTWNHQYTQKLHQETLLSLTNYSLDYSSQGLDQLSRNQITESKKNFVNDYGAQTFLNLDLDSNSHLQFGYQFSSNTIRYSIDNITDDFSITLDEQKSNLQTHSLFSEYEIDFNSKAMIQLGMRANKYSTSDQLFVEPRFYAEATLLPNFKFNGSATITSQAVTQIQESITSSVTLENLLWRITDDSEFNILTSQHYSLGAIYKNKSWFIEGDSFYKLTKNITTLTAGFLNPLNSNFNKGKSKTLGAELFIKKKYKNYSSWISYTFTNQESQFDSVNNGDYFISNLNIEHTFKWQHYYQLNDFQFSLGWLWHSGRATTNVTANKEEGQPVELIYTDLNAQNLPVYHKLDFSVLYNFKFDRAQNTRYQLGVSLNNVYNRKSLLNREFRTTAGIDNELLTLDYNSLGFTPNVSLRVFW